MNLIDIVKSRALQLSDTQSQTNGERLSDGEKMPLAPQGADVANPVPGMVDDAAVQENDNADFEQDLNVDADESHGGLVEEADAADVAVAEQDNLIPPSFDKEYVEKTCSPDVSKDDDLECLEAQMDDLLDASTFEDAKSPALEEDELNLDEEEDW